MTEPEDKPKGPDVPQVRGHCPNCGPGRYADVVGHYVSHENADDSSGVWAQTNYRMLRCGGCKKVYFQETHIFSEDFSYDYHPVTGEQTFDYNESIKYWPAPTQRKRPDYLDELRPRHEAIYGLLNETYNTLDVDARVLAAGGARTVLDCAAEHLGIDPAISFEEKLNELEKCGAIGRTEKDHLGILTNAGGAALHRGWQPSLDQLATVMSVIEPFIHRTFVLDKQLARLKADIPEKQKRRKSEL